MNLDSASEKVLISGAYNTTTGETSFQNLFLDENDAYMYWSNKAGIFRCNMTTLKTDTVFKNCETAIYNRPCRSGHVNEINFSKHVIKHTHPYFLIHTFKALEYNVPLNQIREVTIF
jgi:hypothetical protein